MKLGLNNMRKTIWAATFMPLFASCYSDIDFDNQIPDALPVINAVATPDTVVMASVSRTYAASEELTGIQLRDAAVSLFVNGELYGQMTPKVFDVDIPVGSTGTSEELRKNKVVYMSDYVPSPHDRIAIEAHTDCGNARVEDVVPEAVAIDDAKVEYAVVLTDWGSFEYHIDYKIRFHDNPAQKNYYFLTVGPVDDWDAGMVFINYVDPVFEMQNQDMAETIAGDGALENSWGMTFDDTLINGMDYEMTVKEEVQFHFHDEGAAVLREVRLYSVSEDYYKYLRSVLKDKSREDSALGDLGFYEPVEIFSNVEGGVGILGAQCCARRLVKIYRQE